MFFMENYFFRLRCVALCRNMFYRNYNKGSKKKRTLLLMILGFCEWVSNSPPTSVIFSGYLVSCTYEKLQRLRLRQRERRRFR